MDYFNLAEEGMEKGIGSTDDIALAKAKGKKNNIDSPPEKKYEILSSCRMNDDEVDEQINKSIFDRSEQDLPLENTTQESQEPTENEQPNDTTDSTNESSTNNVNSSNKHESVEESVEESQEITENTTEDPTQEKENPEFYDIKGTQSTIEEGNSSNSLNHQNNENDNSAEGGPNNKKDISMDSLD